MRRLNPRITNKTIITEREVYHHQPRQSLRIIKARVRAIRGDCSLSHAQKNALAKEARGRGVVVARRDNDICHVAVWTPAGYLVNVTHWYGGTENNDSDSEIGASQPPPPFLCFLKVRPPPISTPRTFTARTPRIFAPRLPIMTPPRRRLVPAGKCPFPLELDPAPAPGLPLVFVGDLLRPALRQKTSKAAQQSILAILNSAMKAPPPWQGLPATPPAPPLISTIAARTNSPTIAPAPSALASATVGRTAVVQNTKPILSPSFAPPQVQVKFLSRSWPSYKNQTSPS
jgi:hypothetical protein